MNQTVQIKTIAQELNVRPRRVHEKLQKLGIGTDLEDYDAAISVQDAARLVLSYLQTGKSSESTKTRANELLQNLQKADKPLNSLHKTPFHRKKRHLVQKDKTSKKHDCRYKNIRLFLQKMVHSGIEFLEGSYFKVLALSVAVCVQMRHSADWYYRTSPVENANWYAAFGYAFMVDLFIVVVTMEGKVNIAKTFAAFTFLANILYFQFWVGFDGSVQAFTNAISSVLISGIMAYIIYAYTELFVKHQSKTS